MAPRFDTSLTEDLAQRVLGTDDAGSLGVPGDVVEQITDREAAKPPQRAALADPADAGR